MQICYSKSSTVPSNWELFNSTPQHEQRETHLLCPLQHMQQPNPLVSNGFSTAVIPSVSRERIHNWVTVNHFTYKPVKLVKLQRIINMV